jgi:hypothetical protein
MSTCVVIYDMLICNIVAYGSLITRRGVFIRAADDSV